MNIYNARKKNTDLHNLLTFPPYKPSLYIVTTDPATKQARVFCVLRKIRRSLKLCVGLDRGGGTGGSEKKKKFGAVQTRTSI